MTLWICGRPACGSAFSVGADYCPECGWSSRYAHEEGSEMPRITVHGGVSDRDDIGKVDGGGDVSPGTNSEAIGKSSASLPGTSEPAVAKPATKTQNHSVKRKADDSTARSVAGDMTERSTSRRK